MAAKKSATKRAPTKRQTFTAEESAAIKARVGEMKSTKGNGEADMLAAIAKLEDASRAMAQRLHAIVTSNAPQLAPKTWYGMPAYANADGKVVCFFRPAEKFKDRYATFGFNDQAKLDDGNMWPTSYALVKLTAAEEKHIAALVKKAARK